MDIGQEFIEIMRHRLAALFDPVFPESEEFRNFLLTMISAVRWRSISIYALKFISYLGSSITFAIKLN